MQYTTLYLESGMETPEKTTFEFTNFEDLNNQVNGSVEFVEITINGYSYDLICDDTHKLRNLPKTLAISDNNRILDVISGRIIFLKADEEGRTISLDKDDVQRIQEYFINSTMCHYSGGLKVPVYDHYN